jgi:hypothetical protein
MTLARRTVLAALSAAPILAALPAIADTGIVRIAVQPGMTYLVLNVMQHH